MQLRTTTCVWLLAAALMLAACTGGSGSSGFDISPSAENAAITAALQDEQCVAGGSLTICPADATEPLRPPGAEPTAESVGVDTGLAFQDALRCTSVAVNGACSLEVFLSVTGFPPAAAAQLAWRGTEPGAAWRLSADAMRLSALGPSIEFVLDAATDAEVEVAVLIFLDGAVAAPGTVRTLAEAGADFAFVTPKVPLLHG
jgi:hypothetical protein